MVIPDVRIEVVLAEAILDRIASLKEEVSDAFLQEADDLLEAAKGGDEREVYRAGMIFKAAVDDEAALIYADRMRLALLANAVTYSALERF